MKIYNTIGPICDGHDASIKTARDMALGLDWSEYEVEPQAIGYARYEETVNGLDIYYDYGADYFFFCTDEEDE